MTHSSHDHELRHWHENAFIINIMEAKRRFILKRGHLHPPIHCSLRALPTKPPQLQRLIKKFLTKPLGQTMKSIHHLLRTRISRWRFGRQDLLPGHATDRVVRRLHLLGKCSRTSPACKSAYLKLLLNGLPTTRRMRSIAGNPSEASCLFCNRGQDAIEHFPHCPVITSLFERNGCACGSLVDFFGLDKTSFPAGFPTRANLVHTVHHAHNVLRHNRSLSPVAVILAFTSHYYQHLR